MAAGTTPRQSISVLLLRPVVAALVTADGGEASSSALADRLEALYGATDLTPQLLADPDARVSRAQFCVAWAELLRLTGDPQVALRMAEGLPQGAFGIV